MGPNSLEFEASTDDHLHNLGNLRWPHTHAMHPRVDLEVDGERTFKRSDPLGSGRRADS